MDSPLRRAVGVRAIEVSVGFVFDPLGSSKVKQRGLPALEVDEDIFVFDVHVINTIVVHAPQDFDNLYMRNE